MQLTKLEQSILSTLAFFDVFDAGLTAEEVYVYVWRSKKEVTLDTIQDGLTTLVSDRRIVFDRGYYGIRPLADERITRIALVEHKLAIALRAARKLRYVPFVRAVCVCNNLALGTVRPESDVDVCIIVTPGRIWIARLLVTTLLRLFGLARTRKKEINRVCLSFYVTTDALNMSTLTITDPDIYLMYWVRSLLPIYDPGDMYQTVQEQNSWVDSYIRTISKVELSKRKRVDDTRFSLQMKQLFERMWAGIVGDMIETQAREIQKTKMKFRFDSVRDEPDSRVIISDEMLKFHENDRRVYYKKAWQSRVT